MQKYFDGLIQKAASADSDADFIMSASTPDRVNDTIDPAAYTALVGKSVIALWQHDREAPIGSWKNLRVVGDTLVGSIKFTEATPQGKMVKQMVEEGIPLAASIGFSGKGESKKPRGIHFKSIELMECSVVTVPCHDRAIQIAKEFGFEIPSMNEEQLIVLRRAQASLLNPAGLR